jgi:DNA polymerase-3 subunit beta
MQFIVNRNELLPVVQSVIGAVPNKATMPILMQVHVQGDGQALRMTATDLQVRLTAILKDAPMHEPFAITLPGRKFYDVLRAFPEGGLVGIQVGEKTIVKCGKSRFSLTTMDANDYPVNEDLTFSQTVSLSQATLRSLIDYVSPMMAKQDVRYYLNGLLFELTETELVLAATDGHRLSVVKQALSEPKTPRLVIVPRDSVIELTRLLKEKGECTVCFGDRHLGVLMEDGVQFVTTLIDGKFPEYQRVIPRESPLVTQVSRVAFLEAITRAKLILNEKSEGVALTFKDQQLVIQAKSREEDAEEVIDIDYSGPEFVIGMNAGYLIDVLKVIQGEAIRVFFSEPDNAIKIESADADEGLHVIMSMRL